MLYIVLVHASCDYELCYHIIKDSTIVSRRDKFKFEREEFLILAETKQSLRAFWIQTSLLFS